MSQFAGRQDFTGPKGGRKNKGVMAARREEKRREANARDAISNHTSTGRKARDGELDLTRYSTNGTYWSRRLVRA